MDIPGGPSNMAISNNAKLLCKLSFLGFVLLLHGQRELGKLSMFLVVGSMSHEINFLPNILNDRAHPAII